MNYLIIIFGNDNSTEITHFSFKTCFMTFFHDNEPHCPWKFVLPQHGMDVSFDFGVKGLPFLKTFPSLELKIMPYSFN